MNGYPRGIVAIALFTLYPERERVWLGAWQALADVASNIPACHLVRLLSDSTDVTRRIVVSEWDSREAFDAFWRQAGINWIEDALEYGKAPTNVLIYAITPSPETHAESGKVFA